MKSLRQAADQVPSRIGDYNTPSDGERIIRLKPAKGQKVLVAMSGGVDSSVAAALLLEQGYQVVGCFMRLGSEDSVQTAETCESAPGQGHHQGCCSLNDAADARLVAAMLDVPFYVLNFKQDFGRIMDYFVEQYNTGRTPNPCIRCNDWLKFGKLWSYALSIDARFIATGHYARADHSARPARLLRGLDASKDQSYVLFGTTTERLEHMLLPIGELTKPQVRQYARQRNLPVFDKPDSQEICFVPDNDYARLITQRTPEKVQPGQLLDRQGRVLGQHPGQQHFTIGQRRGLGIATGVPLYVIQKDALANTVTLGGKEGLLSVGLEADQTNWLVEPPRQWRECQVKIRYNSPPAPARVIATGDNRLEVRFNQPLSAVSPGQAVVCYQDEQLLGGGWIERAFPLPPQ